MDAPAPLAPDAAYRVLQAHDARFDGRLFVGVTSTGVYCRPVCRVRLPRPENCRFFAHAAAAECAGFRPCLRCRPELAPGLAAADSAGVLARAGARLIEQAIARGEALAMPAVAARLGVGERHFRRAFMAEHGVRPVDWAATQRLLLAKRLLSDTQLPMTEVALAAGFGSLRRFNAAFAERYRLAPSALRRNANANSSDSRTAADVPTEPVALRLPWRPPYDTSAMQAFLAARPLPGVEAVTHDAGGLVWRRTLAVHDARGQRHRGWLALRWHADQHQASASVSPTLAPVLGAVVSRLRHLLDLDADPAQVDPALHGLPVPLRPGLRVPGCMDGFETATRIVLGQQVSVAAACTLAGRLATALGEPLETPHAGLDRLFPDASSVATADPGRLAALGIVRSRVTALQALARAVAAGEIQLAPGAPVASTLQALQTLPGIGEWTAQMIALRVLAWPDAFPASDLGLRRALGGQDAAQAARLAQAWQPWRSYAVMQLWLADAGVAPATQNPPTGSTP